MFQNISLNQKSGLIVLILFIIIGIIVSNLGGFYTGFMQGDGRGGHFGPGDEVSGSGSKLIGYGLIFFGIFLGLFLWFLPS